MADRIFRQRIKERVDEEIACAEGFLQTNDPAAAFYRNLSNPAAKPQDDFEAFGKAYIGRPGRKRLIYQYTFQLIATLGWRQVSYGAYLFGF